MSDYENRLGESVSALMDGEATEFETHRILKDVGDATDARGSARDKWQRYQIASSVMTGGPVSKIDFSAAISASIDLENAHRINPLTRHANSVGRFAIAASVAMVAILGVQQLNNGGLENADAIQFAEVAVDETLQNTGPALQFPSGFQPNIQARTVSVGGKNKTSRQPVVNNFEVKQPINKQSSDLELRSYLNDIMITHSNHSAVNSSQGMLTFARVTMNGASPETE
jgi:sigma-E factor negative regulatory protein RseA